MPRVQSFFLRQFLAVPSGIADPYTPADGTQNFTGSINASADVTVGGTLTAGGATLAAVSTVPTWTTPTITGSSGTVVGMEWDATVNQSGTAAYTAFKWLVTESATGNGNRYQYVWGDAAGRQMRLQAGASGENTLVLLETGGDFWTINAAARSIVGVSGKTSTLKEGSNTRFSWGSAGVGFNATAPIAAQTSGADLTNNVTSGGTDNTIADFSDLTVYANSAAAIRNNIYQLARKLKQINDGLRAYGLFT